MGRKKVNPIQVNMHEAKTRLSQLAEMVWRGEKVIIAKAGKPYVDLTPHVASGKARKPGRYKGRIRIAKDFDVLPDDVLDAFEHDT
jgi:antitoxin (DNA-binding transcriptional repressor) of toxin-antitoxin stability system